MRRHVLFEERGKEQAEDRAVGKGLLARTENRRIKRKQSIVLPFLSVDSAAAVAAPAPVAVAVAVAIVVVVDIVGVVGGVRVDHGV